MKILRNCLMAVLLAFMSIGPAKVHAQSIDGGDRCSYNSDGKSVPAEPTGFRECKNGIWVSSSSPRPNYPYEAAQDVFVVIMLVVFVGGYFAICGFSKPDGQPL